MSNQRLITISFVISLALIPIVLISALSASLTGLEGINPSYQNREIDYPVSDDVVQLVKFSFALVSPLSIILFILAAINLRRGSIKAARLILALCVAIVLWIGLSAWALDGKPGEARADGHDGKLRTLQISP
jgi:hypothetical protein